MLDKKEYETDDTIVAKVELTNTGSRETVEIVQMYVRDLVGSVTRPVRELKGFRRVKVAPGETVVVEFELPIENLAFYGLDMVKKVEPGDFQMWIAGDSASGSPVSFIVR